MSEKMKESAKQGNRSNGVALVSEIPQESVRGGNTVHVGYEPPVLAVLRFETAAMIQTSQPSATDIVTSGLPVTDDDW